MAVGKERPIRIFTQLRTGETMQLFIFARFHAREGQEEVVAASLCTQVARVRTEPGCIEIEAYRSTRDPRLFYIHSRWIDEAAFEVHARLPGTDRFVDRMQALIDHPFEATHTISLE
jgi:quinol monooxygenase YgiN